MKYQLVFFLLFFCYLTKGTFAETPFFIRENEADQQIRYLKKLGERQEKERLLKEEKRNRDSKQLEISATDAWHQRQFRHAVDLFDEAALGAKDRSDEKEVFRLLRTAAAVLEKYLTQELVEEVKNLPVQARLLDAVEQEVQHRFLTLAIQFPAEETAPHLYRVGLRYAAARLHDGQISMDEYIDIRKQYSQLFPKTDDAVVFRVQTMRLLLDNGREAEAILLLERLTLTEPLSLSMMTVMVTACEAVLFSNRSLQNDERLKQLADGTMTFIEREISSGNIPPELVSKWTLVQAQSLNIMGERQKALNLFTQLDREHSNDVRISLAMAQILSQERNPQVVARSLEYWYRATDLLERDSPAWWEAVENILGVYHRLDQREPFVKMLTLLRLTSPELGGTDRKNRIEAMDKGDR